MENKRKRILDMVKNGKLSTDEALTLLEALDREESGNVEKGEGKTTEQSGRDGEGQKRFHDTAQNFNETKEKLFDLVGGALKKIKEFDFQISQSAEVSHVFQQHMPEIENIEIDIANGNLTFKQWDQEDVRVECRAKVFRTNDREEARSFLLNNSTFSIEDGRLVFATQSKWMKADTAVYIPAAQYRKIILSTFSGNVQVKEIQADHLKIKTLHGKVLLERAELEKADIETGNGTVEFDRTVIRQVEAQTMNGDIRWNGSFGRSDFEAFNGNITVNMASEGDTLHAKTVSGNIEIAIPENTSVHGEGKTNFGSFAIELEGMEKYEERKEMIQKIARFSRKGISETELYVFADAKTGTITIKEQSTNKHREPEDHGQKA
ncbi:hypothetical protein BpJC4_04250 [Weizmannia acidilactici]|uniref:DUF4097 family beta strand repeat-containing protein n=1 Tax=Weizmannia acidilactici TaxID=2607726 RepID=UPI00124DF6C9|nr:DUF4097 domain-containing protein [Weizmannia acidilactici]GER65954.1 hypothetical protein BpJC4_04250 [Weizmannia acidilactici]